MRTINEIIVHCSATFPDQVVTVADITRWHRQLGWKTIGYHFLITLAGAHCTGHTANSIGVCYAGGVAANGKPADTRNEAQKQALLVLLKQLKEQFPNAVIHGHRDFAQKACPCFDATNEYAAL